MCWVGEPGYFGRISDSLRAARPGFDSQQGQESLLFSTAFRLALGPIQLPVQCVPGAVTPGVKRQGREADHSCLSSADVRNTSTPSHVITALLAKG
jgi:hypothetical protein